MRRCVQWQLGLVSVSFSGVVEAAAETVLEKAVEYVGISFGGPLGLLAAITIGTIACQSRSSKSNAAEDDYSCGCSYSYDEGY